MHRRREELAEQVAEQQWNLGGLIYEMAIRDHFRLDLIVSKAALLQESDAELAEIERLLLQDGGDIGACPGCMAPHSRGALFCWQCGGALMGQAPSTAASASASASAPVGYQAAANEDTLVMDPVSAPEG